MYQIAVTRKASVNEAAIPQAVIGADGKEIKGLKQVGAYVVPNRDVVTASKSRTEATPFITDIFVTEAFRYNEEKRQYAFEYKTDSGESEMMLLKDGDALMISIIAIDDDALVADEADPEVDEVEDAPAPRRGRGRQAVAEEQPQRGRGRRQPEPEPDDVDLDGVLDDEGEPIDDDGADDGYDAAGDDEGYIDDDGEPLEGDDEGYDPEPEPAPRRAAQGRGKPAPQKPGRRAAPADDDIDFSDLEDLDV